MSSVAKRGASRLTRARRVRRPLLTASLDTAILFGALGWVYVAVIAVVNPDELGHPVVHGLEFRRDTLAFICFGVSAVSHFIREAALPASGSGPVKYGLVGVANALRKTTFLYSSAVVVYLLGNSIAHPETMRLPLSHLLAWPTEGTVLVLAISCSVVSFLASRISVYRSKLVEGVDQW